jgi:hypothetical protein
MHPVAAAECKEAFNAPVEKTRVIKRRHFEKKGPRGLLFRRSFHER